MTLSTEQQILIEQRVANEAKSVGLAYVLWFFFGSFGLHRFYLGVTWEAWLIPVLIWGGLLLALAGGFPPGIALSGIGGLIVLFDLFFIPGMADRQKRRVRQELTDAASFRSLL